MKTMLTLFDTASTESELVYMLGYIVWFSNVHIWKSKLEWRKCHYT